MASLENKSKKIRELLKITNDVVDGSVDVISACRRIAALRYEVGAELDPLFFPILSIESESDHFILHDMPESQMAEFDEFVFQVRADVLKCCREIFQKFSRLQELEQEKR